MIERYIIFNNVIYLDILWRYLYIFNIYVDDWVVLILYYVW